MAISLFDWTIYRHMFSAERMETIFGEQATIERMIDVEKAVARAQGELGIMPAASAEVINRRLNSNDLDLERLHADSVDVGRPIVGLVRQLAEQVGGAVGTLASMQPDGLAFRRAVADQLGLGMPLSNWHNARDAITETALCLGNLCASLARNAQNINHLSGTDIGELSEAGTEGRGRSSAMAHKRNPRAAEFAEAVARLGRQRAMGMAEVMGQDHDRCGGTWIAEWVLVPETFLLTSGALAWAVDLMGRLDVHEDRMRTNIDATRGLALTERFTLALAERMSEFEARRLLDEACARTLAGNITLSEAFAGMPDVCAVLSTDEISALSDPETYVGAAPEIVDRVLDAATKD